MNHTVTGDELLLDVPASKAFLPVLRTATAGLATRLNFGLGATEDLRVAVDEAAGLLIFAANDETVYLSCRFEVTDSDLVINIAAKVTGPLPSRRSFGWNVLDALAGEVKSTQVDDVATVSLIQRLPQLVTN